MRSILVCESVDVRTLAALVAATGAEYSTEKFPLPASMGKQLRAKIEEVGGDSHWLATALPRPLQQKLQTANVAGRLARAENHAGAKRRALRRLRREEHERNRLRNEARRVELAAVHQLEQQHEQDAAAREQARADYSAQLEARLAAIGAPLYNLLAVSQKDNERRATALAAAGYAIILDPLAREQVDLGMTLQPAGW